MTMFPSCYSNRGRRISKEELAERKAIMDAQRVRSTQASKRIAQRLAEIRSAKCDAQAEPLRHRESEQSG